MRLSVTPPFALWRRSPDAMATPVTVRSTRNPCVTPSTRRTGTGAATVGRGQRNTATRTIMDSVALVNDQFGDIRALREIIFLYVLHRPMSSYTESTLPASFR